jgi:aspartate racemase
MNHLPVRTSWPRTIGIVGGLGPHAHIEFERRLLRAAELLTGRPMNDQDYPPWLLASVPQTPDRTEALAEGDDIVEELARAVSWLGGSHDHGTADFAVIVCNAAYAWLDALRGRVDLPIFDMPGEALRVAASQVPEGSRIGLLGTTGTLLSQVYHRTLERMGLRSTIVTLLDLNEGEREGSRLQEELVMTPIYGPMREGRRFGGGIKSGIYRGSTGGVDPGTRLRRAVKLLGQAGASLVITACTEIPLALGREPVEGIRLLDPMESAAAACVAIASGSRALPGSEAGP